MPDFNPVPARFRVLSGSWLKMAAVVTMLIDHLGAAVLLFLLSIPDGYALFADSAQEGLRIYRILRGIGRTAFPVYCFLLVEGLFHTKSRLRYFLLLFAFALVSEVPFDLAFNVQTAEAAQLVPASLLTLHLPTLLHTGQNVFFTLFLGYGAIWAAEEALSSARAYAKKRTKEDALRVIPRYLLAALLSFLAFAAAYFLADFLQTDYDHDGIVLIIILYLLYRMRLASFALSFLYFTAVMPNEVYSLFAFLMMLFYSGRRGFIKGKAKYLFYAFYPLHLTALYLLRVALLKSF